MRVEQGQACREQRNGETVKEDELPEGIRRLFWDYGDRRISWSKNRELVIRRVLQVGTWDDVTWLRRRLGDQALRRWLLAHEGGGLDGRRLRFWQAVLELPDEAVDAWIARLRESPWENRHRRR